MKGRTAVLTDDCNVELKELKKASAKKQNPTTKKATKRNHCGDITNQQLTAVNLQVCAPFSPYLPYSQFVVCPQSASVVPPQFFLLLR